MKGSLGSSARDALICLNVKRSAAQVLPMFAG
jgi:hypothetical protein